MAQDTFVESIDDLMQNFELIEDEKNSKSGFYLTEEEKKDIIILKYDKDVTATQKDQIFLVVNDQAKKIRTRKLLQCKRAAQQRDFIFKYKTTRNDKLISGLYADGRNKKEKKKTSSNDKDNDIIPMVDSIFIKALKLGTSDVHIEKRSDKTTLKMRVNGELSKIDTFFPSEGEQIAKIIYQVYTSEGGESATTFDSSKPQNGLVDKEFDGQRVRMRIATLPANPDGFDVVCRLLPFNEDCQAVPLDKLGYAAKEKAEVEKMQANSIGGVIVAGVTGSGKSTTLKNILLGKLNARNGAIKCITIEDPPEYFIPGATQVPVNRETSSDGGASAFGDAIKAAMRSDPDIIMVGEVRDKETGTLLRSAIESGHQVFTTVHASSAFGIINRLENLGIPRETMSAPNFISGLIYQRLLPKLCEHCSVGLINGRIPKRYPLDKILLDDIEYYNIDIQEIQKVKELLKPNENLIRKLQDLGKLNSKKAMKALNVYKTINNEDKNNDLLERIKTVCDIQDSDIKFRGQGCKHCNSGIAGRLVCAETVIPDLELLGLIGEGKDSEAANYWKINMNGKFAIEDAIDKMKVGIVDPLDVEHAFSELDVKN
jgi:type II secretory ATPase GspE/PulE/Tfp pilus assembly ATPase PilB-like protein